MKYSVSIPIKGTSTFTVTADSEEAAIEAAWKKVHGGKDGDVTWEYFVDSRTWAKVVVTELEVLPRQAEVTELMGQTEQTEQAEIIGQSSVEPKVPQ